MPVLVKHGVIIKDEWRLRRDPVDHAKPTDIVPHTLLNQTVRGVWIGGDVGIEEIADSIIHLDLIAIDIAGFADGRALTLGTLLRNRFGFLGELRAIGEVLPDFTPFMIRSGFDAFELSDELAANTALKCMSHISDFYQSSTLQKKPPFRRLVRSSSQK